VKKRIESLLLTVRGDVDGTRLRDTYLASSERVGKVMARCCRMRVGLPLASRDGEL